MKRAGQQKVVTIDMKRGLQNLRNHADRHIGVDFLRLNFRRPFLTHAARHFLLGFAVLFGSEVPTAIAQNLDVVPVIPNNNAQNNQQACEIIVSREGVLQPSINNTTLSSKVYLGEPAKAKITTTNSSFRMTVETPIGFKLGPKDADIGTIFSTSVTGRGATSFTESRGDAPTAVTTWYHKP